jgi:hypothetical protein
MAAVQLNGADPVRRLEPQASDRRTLLSVSQSIGSSAADDSAVFFESFLKRDALRSDRNLGFAARLASNATWVP